MGLISRVSSRTYRFTPPHFIMKLTYSAALLAVLATSYVIKAQEDAEDVEAEVLDEEDDVEAEEEADIPEAEAQPQLMPMPLTGVKSFLYFPDGAHTITGGKASDVVVGVQNNGDIDIEIVSVNGRMTYPQNNNEVVQNFTNVGYDKQVVSSKSEASFYYAFMPNIYAGGRDFNIAIEVFYQKIIVKKIGLGKSSGDKKKVETGTSNEGVNMDWIDASHTGLKKRSVKQKSN